MKVQQVFFFSSEQKKQLDSALLRLPANLYGQDAAHFWHAPLGLGQVYQAQQAKNWVLLSLKKNDFDSKIFKRAVYQIDWIANDLKNTVSLSLLKNLILHVQAQLKEQKNPYVVCRLLTQQVEVSSLLESLQFNYLCAMVDLKKSAQKVEVSDKIQVRTYQPSDLKTLVKIAKTSFSFSRFHIEPLFTKRQADQLHVDWVKNSCQRGFADKVLVALKNKKVAGFHFLKTENIGNDLQIKTSLIGVSRSAFGYGVGRALIAAGFNAFNAPAQFRVRTEASNVPALNLYQSSAYKLDHVSLYYRWAV